MNSPFTAVNTSNSPNHILAALPEEEYSGLRPHLRPTDMKLGHTFHHPGEKLSRVYFVENGMFSLVLTAKDGTEVEVGVVGREGVAGASAVLTSTPVGTIIMAQIHGNALSLPADIFREEFRKGGEFQNLVLHHMQAISTMTAQAALCNRLHSIEKRLARWLLQVHDRVGDNYLELTQEFIASMLGTRRAGVTEAAGALREAGLIQYTRGSILILDRARLENAACECHEVIGSRLQSAIN